MKTLLTPAVVLAVELDDEITWHQKGKIFNDSTLDNVFMVLSDATHVMNT